MFDLLIKNGWVVSPDSTLQLDIAIKEGRIVVLGTGDLGPAERVIDAAGKYVLPGALDAHMHVEAPFQGCFGANDFYTQSISAAFGGVTTIMDFTNTFRGDSLLEAVQRRKEEMKKSAIDYGIHVKIVETPPSVIEELEKVVEEGCPSFKVFMTYRKEGVMAEDETLLQVFEKAKELGALAMVHAESNAIAERNIEQFREQGNLSWPQFARSKPTLCEAEAVSRSVHFAKYAGNALLLVHTTCAEGLQTARQAQQEGYPIYVEACPHYLFLFDELYEDAEHGHLAICSPPLRTRREADALWEAMQTGIVTVTGSDDCTYSQEEKSMFLEKDATGRIIPDFTKVVNGLSGLETRVPLLYSEGVGKGRLTINQLCALLSTNVAKLFGCFPQKGIIAPGSDADLVLLDPDKEVTLSPEVLHNNIDYSLFTGMKVKGYPVMTIAGGKVIVEDGRFCGERGAGRFIQRKISEEIVSRFSR